MAIQVADNFSYKGKKPLDSRLVYDTLTAMTQTSGDVLYDGCIAYVRATKKFYAYDSTNSTDAGLGKWREFDNGKYDILDDDNFDEEHPNDYLPQGYGQNDRKLVYVVQTQTFWLWTGISWDEQLQKVITKAKIDALFD